MKPRAHPHKEHPHTRMAGSQRRGFCWTQKDTVDSNKRLGQSRDTVLSLGFLAQWKYKEYLLRSRLTENSSTPRWMSVTLKPSPLGYS